MFLPEFKVKQLSPEALASGLVKRHGAQKAAEVAHKMARPMIGTDNDVPNPSAPYFIHVQNRIKNLTGKSIKTEGSENV